MMNCYKKVAGIILATALLFSLSGCGNSADNGFNEEIELINPVDVKVQTARAEYRDILDGVTYAGKVVPVVSDVTFAEGQSFLKYGVLPGSSVKAGDTVIYASTESIDEQIKNLKELIANNQENYEETIKDLNVRFEEAKSSKEYWGEVYEYILKNPTYSLAREQTAIYRNYVALYEELEQEIKKTTALYEVDADYNNLKLQRLVSGRKNVLASAKNAGTVVAINYFGQGDRINKDEAVAAVGDLSRPVIECEYISKNDINKAERFYAVINGKHYEVEYKELDKEQYNQLLEKNDNVYTTFTFTDEYEDVNIGDYASIVLVTNDKKDMLCVPSQAISKDEQGAYVYVVEGENNTYVSIKTGKTYGLYTEVLSGLNEGDEVLCENKPIKSKGERALTTGGISNTFSQTGYLFYPKREWVNNPVEYGVTYIDEILVNRYERVTKGQVIAKINVVPDTINIQRQERSLLRANEDLNRFIENNKDLINKEDSKTIKQLNIKKDNIKDLEEKIAKMKSDGASTVIKATSNGIVTDLRRFESGAILNYKAGVIEISSEEDSFVVVEDENKQLTYGNAARISYTGSDGTERHIEGEVVTVTPDILSKSLKTGYALIKVSPEDLEDMAASSMGYEGWWNRSRFKIEVSTRAMDNVVLVPKSAVTKEGDTTYVAVLDEDGNSRLVSFISGGSDVSNYWVAEGLMEGTKICLE